MSLPENRKKFEELISKWILIEDGTIEVTKELIAKTANPIVKVMIELIKLDSEKHKMILEAIRLSLDSTVVFSQDDVVLVNTFIEKHESVEKNAITTAEQALDAASLPIPKLLLSHLLDDEKSHDAYMGELEKLKGYMAKHTQ